MCMNYLFGTLMFEIEKKKKNDEQSSSNLNLNFFLNSVLLRFLCSNTFNRITLSVTFQLSSIHDIYVKL